MPLLIKNRLLVNLTAEYPATPKRFWRFLSLFGLDPDENTSFFQRITDQEFRLIHSQLIYEPCKTKDEINRL